MSEIQTEDTSDRDERAGLSDEEKRVLRWRFQQTRRLGLSHIEARLAAETGVDLGLLRSLVAQGCPPTLALKIAL
jgi:hypothetical protein